jgi:hypothetical protein
MEQVLITNELYWSIYDKFDCKIINVQDFWTLNNQQVKQIVDQINVSKHLLDNVLLQSCQRKLKLKSFKVFTVFGHLRFKVVHAILGRGVSHVVRFQCQILFIYGT